MPEKDRKVILMIVSTLAIFTGFGFVIYGVGVNFYGKDDLAAGIMLALAGASVLRFTRITGKRNSRQRIEILELSIKIKKLRKELDSI